MGRQFSKSVLTKYSFDCNLLTYLSKGMLNKINSTFGQRAGPHCNQEQENKNVTNCFPVAKKGNTSKGLFKGEEIRQLHYVTVTLYGLELQLQIIFFKGVLPEGWIQAELLRVSGSCWGNLGCQRWSISCRGCTSRSLLIAGLQSDAAAPLPLLRAGGHVFLPAPSPCFLGEGLRRHRSCALFQEREQVSGSSRDAARREGSHDCQEPAGPSWARRWERGRRERLQPQPGPAPSTARHLEQRNKDYLGTILCSSKSCSQPMLRPRSEFCHMLGLKHRESV